MSLREHVCRAVWMLYLGLPCAPVVAQDAADGWLLSAGGEIDEDGGYRVDAGVTWLPSESTTVTLLAGTADTSTDLNDFYSRAASIAVDHSFGNAGLTADVRWWGDPDLFESTTLAGSVYWRQAGWRVALRGEFRQSDFEKFTFDVQIPIRGVLVPVSGAADCDLDNSAYGLSIGHSGETWSAQMSGLQYEYSSPDCALTDVVLPPQAGNLPPLTQAIFRRIANAVLNRGAELLGSQLTRDNGFLDYSIWGSLAYRSGLRSFGLDYFHDREEFAGSEADTIIGSVTFPVSARLDLEFRLGATDSDLEGMVSFVGLTLFAYLGG